MINVTLVGRIGKEAEKTGSEGTIKFSLATEVTRKKEGKYEKETIWWTIFTSSKLDKALGKGNVVAVTLDDINTFVKEEKCYLSGYAKSVDVVQFAEKKEGTKGDGLPF